MLSIATNGLFCGAEDLDWGSWFVKIGAGASGLDTPGRDASANWGMTEGRPPEGRRSAKAPAARLALACSGLGHVFRGYERFFEDLGEKLRGQWDFQVFRGAGATDRFNRVVPCIRRTSRLGRRCVSLLGESRLYDIEVLTFAMGLFLALLRGGYRLVFVADYKLAGALCRLRPLCSPDRRFIIMFHNGAAFPAKRLTWADLVQQVTAPQYEEAVGARLSQSRFLPIPVDVHRFRPQPKAAMRAKLGLPSQGIVVLCVAAHEKVKQIDCAIRAVTALGDAVLKKHDVRLLIAGETGPCTRDLRALARESLTDRVWFRRFRPEEMPEVFSAADLCVAPSQPEGFGIVLVEAMACGLPVVANADPRKRSILGDAALFVDVRDPEAFGSAVMALVTEELLRSRLVVASVDRVRRHYSWEALLPTYVEFIQEAAGLLGQDGRSVRTEWPMDGAGATREPGA